MKQQEPVSFGIAILIVATGTALLFGIRWILRRVERWARRKRARRNAVEIVLALALFFGISVFIVVLTNQ